MHPVIQAKEEIKKMIEEALRAEDLDGFGAEVELEKPKDAGHHRYAAGKAGASGAPADRPAADGGVQAGRQLRGKGGNCRPGIY